MSKNSYKFFENKDCKYYPCHKGWDKINCLFCYCPLYFIKDCGGNYRMNKDRFKDCSECIVPHDDNGYEYVNKVLKDHFNKNKKKKK